MKKKEKGKGKKKGERGKTKGKGKGKEKEKKKRKEKGNEKRREKKKKNGGGKKGRKTGRRMEWRREKGKREEKGKVEGIEKKKGKVKGRTHGRTDTQVILYSVQCYALHWTNKNLGAPTHRVFFQTLSLCLSVRQSVCWKEQPTDRPTDPAVWLMLVDALVLQLSWHCLYGRETLRILPVHSSVFDRYYWQAAAML